MKYSFDELSLNAFYKARNYKELALMTIDYFKAQSVSQLALVSGPITNGGLGNAVANTFVLEAAGDYLEELGHDVFPTNCINPVIDHLYSELHIQGYPYELITDYFGELIQTGLITQLFMLPSRQNSTGAKMEHEIANQAGSAIDTDTLARYAFLAPEIRYQIDKYLASPNQ